MPWSHRYKYPRFTSKSFDVIGFFYTYGCFCLVREDKSCETGQLKRKEIV